MRSVIAALIVFLGAPTVMAQSESSQPGVATKPIGQPAKFRNPGLRPATLRARGAARRSQLGTQPAVPGSAEGGTIRAAAAAARKRAPAPSAASRDSAMSPADRLAIQLDLAWTGDYTGVVSGEANEKTTAAIKAFQKNRKFKETGVLNTQERAVLAAASRARQNQVGWSMVDDPATGARLGIPNKQVPNRTQSKSGSRWSSAQGQVQVETFRIREPGTTLASVYEQQKKEPSTRRLDVNVLRPDFFVLGGMQSLKKFYVRAEFRDGEVRGMTVLYDQATENIMDPAAAAMTSVFTGFPSASGVAQLGQPSKRKVEYGTGIFVTAAGHILTDRQLTDGCNVIVVSGYGNADRQGDDPVADLALLRVYGVPDLVPASFASDGVEADLTVLGIADPQAQAGGAAVSAVPVKAKGEIVEPAPQLGFSGAPVLDGKGRFVGMVQLKNPIVASIGAANSQPQAALISGQTIRGFLEAQNLPLAIRQPGAAGGKASVVRVICVRK
jgi:peptidoglycan hydrolase-like protein with peptidoglycan-binding domain